MMARGAWLVERPRNLFGLVLVVLLVVTVLLGLLWTPYDPIAIDLGHPLQPPSLAHWLGTDQFGRDVLSRAMIGARISAGVALETVIAAAVCGTAFGLFTGYLRGWTDRLIMMLGDAVLAFPPILLALALVAIMGPSRHSVMLALSIAYVPVVTRVVRGSVLSIREGEYIQASVLCGDSTLYTLFRHVLPNAVAPIVVLATSLFGWVVLYESALSFLGVGVPPPAPTWGNMLADSRPYMETASWLSIVPGLCIVGTLLGVNLLGDALRDWLDPRER
ncbi:MAG: ABC transporter permease [Gammaproteobacteria bacterium]|nr:ABC transporter permease [Gammaproteobacteria bacterium]